MKARLVELDDIPWSLTDPAKPRPRRIGGLDISFFSDGEDKEDARACVAFVVCEFDENFEDLTLVWKDFLFVRMTQPYIAGYLAFREAPHYSRIMQRLWREKPGLWPDVTLVDGNGVLHPHGFGVASHIGVLMNHCTVGVAKNLHMVDGLNRDSCRDLCSKDPGCEILLRGTSGQVLGAAILPQPRKPPAAKRAVLPAKNPVYVSVGHRISLETAVGLVKRCFLSARVPEPVRLADLLSREQVRLVKEKDKKEANAAAPPASQSLSRCAQLLGIGAALVATVYIARGPVRRRLL